MPDNRGFSGFFNEKGQKNQQAQQAPSATNCRQPVIRHPFAVCFVLFRAEIPQNLGAVEYHIGKEMMAASWGGAGRDYGHIFRKKCLCGSFLGDGLFTAKTRLGCGRESFRFP
jgi:hypothetical protein